MPTQVPFFQKLPLVLHENSFINAQPTLTSSCVSLHRRPPILACQVSHAALALLSRNFCVGIASLYRGRTSPKNSHVKHRLRRALPRTERCQLQSLSDPSSQLKAWRQGMSEVLRSEKLLQMLIARDRHSLTMDWMIGETRSHTRKPTAAESPSSSRQTSPSKAGR